MENRKGLADLLVVIFLVVVVAAAAFVLASRVDEKSEATSSQDAPESMVEEKEVSEPGPISPSNEVSVMEKELDATVAGEFEADVKSLESDASGL